jgi:hypothetical protein
MISHSISGLVVHSMVRTPYTVSALHLISIP